MKHSQQVRRARKIGEAVFRGASSVYNFEVFPLTSDIRDSGAVFIISRRITDRFKAGHHRTICVGEADSIVREIKRHKRAKCVKVFEANTLCLMRQDDEKLRSGIIDDLVAGRSFNCVRSVVKSHAKGVFNGQRPDDKGSAEAAVSDKRKLSQPRPGRPRAKKTAAERVRSGRRAA
jgi:hypothetical protein